MEISRSSYPGADETHILCNMDEEAWDKSGRKIHLYPQKQHNGKASVGPSLAELAKK